MASPVTVRRIAPARVKASIKKISTRKLQEALAEAREQDSWVVHLVDGTRTDRGAIRSELDRRIVDPIEGAAPSWDFWDRDDAAGLEWHDD